MTLLGLAAASARQLQGRAPQVRIGRGDANGCGLFQGNSSIKTL